MYAIAIREEHSFLSQRAHVALLKDGDQCTSFFFRRIASRRVKSRIYRILDSTGIEVEGHNQVWDEFVGFFSQLLGSSTRSCTLPDSVQDFISGFLTEEEATGLIA